jgi:hypothetical protein
VHAGGVRDYWVDPSLNTHSGLYTSDACQRRWQFFSSSDSSTELSTAGAPFALPPRSAHGYKEGFPVFFPVVVQHPLSVSMAFFFHECRPQCLISSIWKYYQEAKA